MRIVGSSKACYDMGVNGFNGMLQGIAKLQMARRAARLKSCNLQYCPFRDANLAGSVGSSAWDVTGKLGT